MTISRIFILRPIATSLCAAAALFVGILAYLSLPVADMPNIDLPIIMVEAHQSGGTPSEVASTIAAPLERHLGVISGLNEMTSSSTENQTRIILQFDLSRDINGAARDVAAALQDARQDLPKTLREDPTYFKANPFGVCALADAKAARMSSKPIPNLKRIRGFISTRTAGRALPPSSMRPTPLTWLSCC